MVDHHRDHYHRDHRLGLARRLERLGRRRKNRSTGPYDRSGEQRRRQPERRDHDFTLKRAAPRSADAWARTARPGQTGVCGGVAAVRTMIRPPAERPLDFRHRDPTKWLVAILVAAGAVAALVAINRYLGNASSESERRQSRRAISAPRPRAPPFDRQPNRSLRMGSAKKPTPIPSIRISNRSLVMNYRA